MTATESSPASTRSGEPMLVVDDIALYYGNIAAVKGLSIQVNKGEIVTLIGSNGAGKSTTLRAISGLIKARSGTITFQGEKLNGKQGHEIVKAGICQSPEGRRIFPRMTVSENLDLGAFLRNDKEGIAADRARVLELFPRLADRISQKAGTMSGGEQQMLAVARALMGSPQLLLLDEPTAGMNPQESAVFVDFVRRVREERGLSILLIEHDMSVVMRVSERITVLDQGEKIAEGGPDDIRNNPRVVEAYLGRTGTEGSAR